MGAFQFRTDPGITFRGLSRPFDPIASFSRIAQLRRLQQAGKFGELQLEDFQREKTKQQNMRNAALESQGNPDTFTKLLRLTEPQEAFRIQGEFAQQDRAAAVEQRAAEKHQLSKWLSDLEFIARKAAPLDAFEKQGADPETLQVMYADALEWLDSKGVDVSRLPKKYTSGYAAIAIAESIPLKDQFSLRLRQAELEERQEPTPGVHVPFPPKVEAQKRRLARPTRPPATRATWRRRSR